jgi:hypothetical protein
MHSVSTKVMNEPEQIKTVRITREIAVIKRIEILQTIVKSE